VTLNSTMNPRIGKMTLLVLMRFFGSPYCLDLVKAIHDRAREFELHLCNVSIVCRGSKEGGLKWRKLTGINFPVLADEHRDFVTSLQFKQSVFHLTSTDMIHKVILFTELAVAIR
jgi:peroxiredoxin